MLKANFHHVESEFDFAKSSDGHTVDEIQTFLEDSVKDGCEGLMVKMLTTDNSTYEPSRRSMNWLKVSDKMGGMTHERVLIHFVAEKGLPVWSRGFARPSRRRGLFRERETNISIRSFPLGMLRPRFRTFPNYLQDRYGI